MWVCGLLPSQAAVAPATPTAEAMIQWVRQLENGDFAKREEAQQRLIAIGPPVLEHLPSEDVVPAGETRSRLQTIRQKLERMAEQARQALVNPTQVTLEGKWSLQRALAEFERQTGNKVADYREQLGQDPHDPELELQLRGADFWPALDHVLDRAGMTLYAFTDSPRTLAFVQREDNQHPAIGRVEYADALRIEPVSLNAVRHLQDKGQDALSITLGIGWEPRLTPLVLQLPIPSLRIDDDQGTSLLPAAQETHLEVSVDANQALVDLEIPAALPPRNASMVRTLSGTLRALIAGPIEEFPFKDLETAKPIVVRKENVTLTVEDMRKSADVYELLLAVQYDEATGVLDSPREWIFANEAFLVDSKGTRIDYDGLETFRQTPEQMGISFKFVLENGPAGMTFIYRCPASIIPREFPFELRDLPLP